MIKGVLSSAPTIVGELTKNGKYKDYNGSYEINPSEEDQVLSTKDKLMSKDVLIRGVGSGTSTIVWIEATITSEMLFECSASIQDIHSILVSGKWPIIATEYNGQTQYFILSNWAYNEEKSDGFAVFEAEIENTHYTASLRKIFSSYRWLLQTYKVASVDDVRSVVTYYDFYFGEELDDQFATVTPDIDISDIVEDYTNKKSVIARFHIDDEEIILNPVSINDNYSIFSSALRDDNSVVVLTYSRNRAEEYSSYLWLAEFHDIPTYSAIESAISNKVDKIEGKGLSTNDYTTVEKNKLEGIAPGAQVNVVTAISTSGTGATHTIVIRKGITTYIVYSKDAMDAILASKANLASVYTKQEVDQKLVSIMSYKGTVSSIFSLPVTGNKEGDVWHVTEDGSEWAWNGVSWEELGTTVDLSAYRTAEQQDSIDESITSSVAGAVSQLIDRIDTKLAIEQGAEHAGEFLVVGNDGNITSQAMTNAETEAL